MPRTPITSRRPARVALACVAALTAACADGDAVVPSGLDPPDMQLAPRYAVSVDVLEAGEGCVIGGFVPAGEMAEAVTDQIGANVEWSQFGLSGNGRSWNLTGHICPVEPRAMRLYGGRSILLGDGGDAVCQVELALPAGHDGSARTRNRCEDAPCTTLALVDDGCAGWVADFEARLAYGEGCADQPTCIMRMRWHATPEGAEAACTPDLSAAEGWMVECRTLPEPTPAEQTQP